MPAAHITRSISFADGRAYTAGSVVDLTGPQLQEGIAGGWAEVPGPAAAETPEALHTKRSQRPERRGS